MLDLARSPQQPWEDSVTSRHRPLRPLPSSSPPPPPCLQLKGAAAGVMALSYQVAHVVGLAAATLLVYLLFGEIRVH